MVARSLLIAVAVLLGGCTAEWDAGAPGIPLTGTPPPLDSFHKLNTKPAGQPSLMQGPDGAPWTAFCEFWSGNALGGARTCKRMNLVRIDAADGDEVIEGDQFAVF